MNTRSYAWGPRRRILMVAALSVLAASAPALACTYCVKHAFAGGPGDGGNSTSSLVQVGSCYYGTTQSGGTYGHGTVFSLCGTTWTVMHNFAGGTTDGALPYAGLTYDPLTGLLYGTTLEGGAGPVSNCPDFQSCGTIYQISMAFPYAESVFYSFQGVNAGTNTYDGYAPYAGLTYNPADGMLYGTTNDGGNTSAPCSTTYSSCGTVYQINPPASGSEYVLYSFQGPGVLPADGANPTAAPIIDAFGNLYGTTGEGGAACADLPDGCGTVYELSSVNGVNWSETTYSFKGALNNDGASPHGGLVYWQNAFWGTTFWGGANKRGMVFRLSTTYGPDQNIHNFTGGADGGHPNAGLTIANNRLYGDTTLGANTSCSYYYVGGCGTIFRITGTGPFTFSTRYSFNNNHNPRDGGSPFDALLWDGNFLWGTTYGGGTYGHGTVFTYPPL